MAAMDPLHAAGHPDAPVDPHGLPPAPGYVQSLPREHGFEPLRVEGAIPHELRGTLYRVGPALFELFGRRYAHPFEADGAVTAVRFAVGRAQGAVRVVVGADLAEERRRGHPLYGSIAPWPRRLWNGLRARSKNAANTALLAWQGELLALYEANRPTRIAPDDLATRGETDLGGVVHGGFSAHPHAVLARGALYNFGLRYGPRTHVDFFELPFRGSARLIGSRKLRRPVMLHDFVATERHLVLFVSPVEVDVARGLLGLGSFGGLFQWRPEHGTEVIVVPIDRPDDTVTFVTDASWQWHFAGGQERDGQIVLHRIHYDDFASFEQLGEGGRAGTGRLHRTVLDVARRRMRSEPLWDVPCEFPRVDERHPTPRHVFVMAQEAGRRAVARVDLEGGSPTRWLCGEGERPSEAVFVPRAASGEEGDGWLLTLVYDPSRHQSHVVVLDARNLGEGPVARAWFDHHVPMTFHGLWWPDDG